MLVHFQYENVSHYVYPSPLWADQSLYLPISTMSVSIVMSSNFQYEHVNHNVYPIRYERVSCLYICPSPPYVFQFRPWAYQSLCLSIFKKYLYRRFLLNMRTRLFDSSQWLHWNVSVVFKTKTSNCINQKIWQWTRLRWPVFRIQYIGKQLQLSPPLNLQIRPFLYLGISHDIWSEHII